MKKSKLKKLIKESIRESHSEIYPSKVNSSEFSNNAKFTEVVDSEKIKIKKLILGLTKCYKINVNIHENRINLYAETNSFYFNIDVIKGVGVVLEKQTPLSKSKSSNIKYDCYDEILPDIYKCLSELNTNNLNEIYVDLMSEYKLLRDSNLEDLLDQSKADLSEL